ncbi:fasciclin domain-containing protein [Iningainema tapete]|uniref:Fasciclin domain-containing protein n=1 Tax=Iningainema tapete BLCC-T55 TaxID=2748662 RepID=A0A8J6XD98_9CYAN|nr:fasciclin domain-containing protein [Iningainema tapete]MBD2771025.1 fasciclin domain-containing protein [Iningainema tapete BLCC-T55]
MKPNQLILRKVLFGIISVGSVVALSACNNQPTAQNTTPQQAEESPVASTPSATEVQSTTTAPATPSTTTTQSQNLAQLAQAANSAGSYTTLFKAVQAAGLTDQLTKKGPYTVFAPNDAAFAALPKGTLEDLLKPQNKNKLAKVLAYHVVPGKLTSSQLKSGKVKTVEGQSVTVKVTGGSQVGVNNANVLQADIPATNGVVHTIDKVLLPPGK